MLLEENTYTRGESALWARAPVRQGEPVSLGPASTWKQESFEGGLGQTKWRDDRMYYVGDADTRKGTIICKYMLHYLPGSVAVADDSHKIFAVRPVNVDDKPNLYYASTEGSVVRAVAEPNSTPITRFTAPGSHKIKALGRGFAGGGYWLGVDLAISVFDGVRD